MKGAPIDYFLVVFKISMQILSAEVPWRRIDGCSLSFETA